LWTSLDTIAVSTTIKDQVGFPREAINTTTMKDKGSFNKAAISTKTLCECTLKDQVRFTKTASSNTRTIKDQATMKDKGSFNKAAISTKTLCECTLKYQVRFTKTASSNTRTIKDQVGFTREAQSRTRGASIASISTKIHQSRIKQH
jgi:hypothetical protein